MRQVIGAPFDFLLGFMSFFLLGRRGHRPVVITIGLRATSRNLVLRTGSLIHLNDVSIA